MQQFQVPQFIEIEDKIFGPLTVKQLVYMLGGVGVVLVLWALNIPGIIFWPLAAIFGGFAAALGFLKINGQPFVTVLSNALSHITGPRLYIWKHAPRTPTAAAQKPVETSPLAIPSKLTESKLKNLAWSLDINEKLNR